jgi:hypothetical protein
MMKNPKTTIAGVAAGLATLLTGLPASSNTTHTVAVVVCALALVALGWHATDCPANCPGMKDGIPRDPRSLVLLAFVGMITAAIAIALLSGCAFVRATTYRNQTGQDQIPKEKTALVAYTLFDSGQVLAKARASSGYSTNGQWAPGASLSGVNQWATSTNLDELVSAVASGVVSGLTAGTPTIAAAAASTAAKLLPKSAAAQPLTTASTTNTVPTQPGQTTNAAPDWHALVAQIVAQVLAGLTNSPPPPQK